LMRCVAAALLHTTAALSMAKLPLQPSSKVVILGGGLQGCASAYYLQLRGFDDVTIVERTSVAAAASGKGGGFLARGWGSGPTRALHEVSFDLHAGLAKTLGLKTYRKIKTLSVTGELGLREWPPRDKAKKPKFSPDSPAWLDKEDTGAKLMDPDTAQVVPKELCEAFFEASGTKLVEGRAGGLEMNGESCTGVNVGDAVIPCDAVVCAMGAWSVLLEDWIGADTCVEIKVQAPHAIDAILSPQLQLLDGVEVPRHRRGVVFVTSSPRWPGGSRRSSQ